MVGLIYVSVVIIFVLKISHFVAFRNVPHIIHCNVFAEGRAP